MTLDNRTCVVTGASRGIGAEIAKQLAEDGANVVVNYRSSEAAAEEVASYVEAETDGEAVTVQADVSDAEAVEAMAEATHEAFGPADVLVNNAGITLDGRFENIDHDRWQTVLDVNLTGVYNCTDAFYDDIKESDQGRIINMSSIVGEAGNFGQANYAASKSGLIGFTKTLARELASKGSTANCVAPGFIETDMLADVPEKVREGILTDIPLDRFGEPEEIAHAVHFLASGDSSYMTGQTLSVNGGKHL
ncbi:MAG: 3-oxoacyl-[acyl-carrier-protein] reductase [Halapricum sp.]